jgi:hypothetical protein
MIRHALHGRSLPLSILALPVAMIEPAFRAGLVTTIGHTLLLAAGLAPACDAAIAMSAIAVRADVEDRLTWLPAACALEQNSSMMMHGRVHSSGGRLDKRQRFMSG